MQTTDKKQGRPKPPLFCIDAWFNCLSLHTAQCPLVIAPYAGYMQFAAIAFVASTDGGVNVAGGPAT